MLIKTLVLFLVILQLVLLRFDDVQSVMLLFNVLSFHLCALFLHTLEAFFQQCVLLLQLFYLPLQCSHGSCYCLALV